MKTKEIRIIKAPKLSEVLNVRFVPLWNSTDRFNILWGGRGSSKSDFVAYKIVNKMINDNYFKGIAIMKLKDNIEKNLWGTVLKVIYRYGLEDLFDFKKSPFTITCKQNKNLLYFGGLSDPSSYRGISDPTLLWFEESPPENEQDWAEISLTLRSSKAILQEWYTLNPVIENYEDHWFYKKFFLGESELDFRKKIEITNEDNVTYTQWATVMHSTLKDNRFLDDGAITAIELMAASSPYLYQVFKLGVWANKIIEGRYYNKFEAAKHVYNRSYDSAKPLHVSWDFNRLPYSGITIYQVYDKEVYCIDEICIFNKDSEASSLEQSCHKLLARYGSHTEGIYVYGDPAGRQERSDTKPGHNEWHKVMEQLKSFKPILRVAQIAPRQKTAGEFINSIFEHNYSGIKIFINSNCKELLKDLMYMKMNREGDIEVEYVKNEDDVKMEKYGHQGANFRYFLTSYFSTEYNLHKNPSTYATQPNLVRVKPMGKAGW